MGLYNDQDLNQQVFEAGQQQGPVALTAPEDPAAQPLSGITEDNSETLRLLALSPSQNNYIVSAFENGIGNILGKTNPTYNAIDQISDTKYQKYPEYFTDVDNDEMFNDRKRQVDEMEEYQQLSSRAPNLSFWSGMAWGMADPLLAVPGVGAAKIVKAGASATKSAIATGAITATAMAGEEVLAQNSMPQRSATESAIVIGAGAVVGSAFGAVAGKIWQPAINKELAQTRMDKAIATSTTKFAQPAAVTTDRQASEVATKAVLEIGDDAMPPNIEQARLNQAAMDDIAIVDSVDDFADDNMAGHVSPVMKKWTAEHPYDPTKDPHKILDTETVSDEEINAALNAQTVDADMADDVSKSIGAAQVSWDVKYAGLPIWAQKAFAVPGLPPVSLMGMTSDSGVVRDLTSRLFYMHLPLEDAKGAKVTAPVSLESQLQQDLKMGLDFNKQMDATYLRYAQVDPESRIGTPLAAMKSRLSGGKLMTSKELDVATMDAMNNFDRHAIPEVVERAQYARQLTDKQAKGLRDVGFDFEVRPDWFKWTYDMNKVINNRLAFEQVLAKGFVNKAKIKVVYTEDGKELIDDAIMDATTGRTNWVPKPGQKLKEVQQTGEVTDILTAQEVARDTANKILKLGDKQLTYSDVDRLMHEMTSDSFKPRVLDQFINYEDMKQFLVQDFRELMHHYMSGSSRLIRFKTLMTDLGIEKPDDIFTRIRDEYDPKINRMMKVKTLSKDEIKKLSKEERVKYMTPEKRDAAVAKLTRSLQKAEKEAKDVMAISMGSFKKRTSADPFWRILNQYNAARLLGGVVISSLADPTSAFIKNSVPDVIWNGWIGELKRMVTFTNHLKLEDFRDGLTAVQGEMDDAVRFLMNPDAAAYTTAGPVEKASQGLAQLGMRVNLMQYWNNFWQRVNHGFTESKVLRFGTKGFDKLSSRDQNYLREIGLDETWMPDIMKLQAEFGDNVRGTHLSNTRFWEGSTQMSRERAIAVKERFLNAIRTEVHKSPLLTEKGDLPAWIQQSEARKSLFQFKGFPSAATTKLGLSMASRHDARAATGLIGLVSAGIVSHIIYEKLRGRDVDLSIKNLLYLILKGIDKSGVLGLIADPLFQAKYAHDNIKKYGSKAWITEPVDYIVGPNASIINPAYSAIMAKIAGENTDAKTQAQLKSLIPFQNNFLLKLLQNGNKNDTSNSRLVR